MDIKVTTQRTTTLRGNTRWAYCIERPGWWPHVSDYRYTTEGSARQAGERDAAALAEIEEVDGE